MNLKITQFEFPNLETAWEGINEYLANEQDKILAAGGSFYSSEMVLYDTVIHCFKSTISDDFNFGKALGYRNKKWSKLINNYVNFNYLDLVKSEVNRREGRRGSHYTHTFHFDNSHGSGKDCLISLTFCRRKGQDNPFVIYNTRASEATSRMIFDFLLIQRIVEYVYGKGKTVEVVCYIPFVFINVERFLIYMAYKGKKVVKIKDDTPTRYQANLLKKYKFFKETPIEQIKYKIHKRVAMQVKKDKDGNPIANVQDLFAKDLTFPYNRKIREKDIAKLNNGLTI